VWFRLRRSRGICTLQTLPRIVEQDILAASPCAGLKVTSEQPRERVLSNDELRAVAAAANGTAVQRKGTIREQSLGQKERH